MRIDVEAEVAPDVSVVLLDANGQAGSDDDLVFWNAPVHPSGAVTIDDFVNLDAASIPAQVDSAVLILSTFEVCTEGRLVVEGTGYDFPALTEGQAVVAVTVSRRDGWTLRATPRLMSDLETLLASFGIDVGGGDEDADGDPAGEADGETSAGSPFLDTLNEDAADGDPAEGPATKNLTPDASPGHETSAVGVGAEVAVSEPVATNGAGTVMEPKPRGRSRRIRKSVGGMQLTKDLSADEAKLLEILPADGSTLSRAALLGQLGEGWATSRFYSARDSLVERGLAASVRGRGGGLQRVATEETPPEASAARYTNEASLYPPMRRVLENDWAEDHGFEPIKAEITASQGRRATGGTWTRPDVVMTQVRIFDYLPGKYLEVITFEIKPRNAVNVLAVYEAVSHRRSATRSYVIFHVPSAETAGMEQQLSGIDDVARQHGVGIIVAGDPADYSTWEDRVDAEHWDPDPGRLNLFIKTQLSAETKSKIIRDVR